MNKKLLLIDTKCPLGHVNLYRAQIREYALEGEVTFATTREFFSHFEDLDVMHLDISGGLKLDSRKFGRKLQQIRWMLPVLRGWRKQGFDECVILSFDTHVLGIVSWLVSLKGVSCFAHNNIDELLTSRSKYLIFSMIPHSLLFLVFEEYIAEFLRTRFSVKARAVHHDRRVMEPGDPPDLRPANGRSFVFSPSKESDPGFLKALLAFCEDRGLTLVTKPSAMLLDRDDVLVQDRFDNYDDLFMAAEYIACGIDYRYRISGVLYEALGNGKKIVANDCLFVRNIASEAGDALLILNESAGREGIPGRTGQALAEIGGAQPRRPAR